MYNKRLFYDYLREHLGTTLTQQRVDGFEVLLNESLNHNISLNGLAYLLATAWWETGRTMQPVKEYGSQKYLESKPYYPYVGRGYVQLTWEYNYKKYGIEKTPDKAMDPSFAAYVIFHGMLNGTFTGKKISDYINENKTDYIGARRIVNGTDKASTIAEFANIFQAALEAAYMKENVDNSRNTDYNKLEEKKGSKPLLIIVLGILGTLVYSVLKSKGIIE